MQREANCRITNSMIQYVRKNRPEALGTFLDGFEETKLSNEHCWISAHHLGLLTTRVEQIFNDESIMYAIGEQAVRQNRLGIVNLLLRLNKDPVQAIALSAKYISLFSAITKIKILELTQTHAVVERRTTKQSTRGNCLFTQGIYSALFKQLRLSHSTFAERSCSVPIWEKGILHNNRFYLEQGHVWRENLVTHIKTDLGPLPADGSMQYEGVLYGAPSCVYHFQWHKKPVFWFELQRLLKIRPGMIDQLLQELFYEYKIIERQNQQLRRNNKLLEQLVEERTEFTQKLEKKIDSRTLELEDMVTQLRELDEMKSYFLSITSHELRTPLTIIKGALNLLISDGEKLEPQRYQKYLLMARNNADHLNVLISNLLDLSRLESGQLKLEVDSVDMVRLARESVETFREVARKSNIQISCEVQVETPYLNGDPLRLRQIIDNLLSNALKFTPTGGKIKVQVTDLENAKEIRVADTGIGIEEWEKEKIFKKFQQAERSLTREAAGVGLGLAIVKDLVELHEGTIVVESVKGKGSTFIIQIPQKGPQNRKHIAKRMSRDGQEPPILLGGK